MGESGAEKRGKIGAEGRGESSHSFFSYVRVCC